MKKLITHDDFLEFFANKLINDASLFEQQKMLIESQINSSRQLFKKMFGTGEEFKLNARKYLKGINLI